jgi:photosystem II stability/assembly factor-like uncharacterized protein
LLIGALGVGAVIVVATFLLLRSDDGGMPSPDAGPVHVHGLGVNPADGSLFIATHTGLYRTAPDESRATRVGDTSQDTMGFTIVGPDRFLGSGHPDLRQGLPPLLGLIESTNAGESWEPVSLLGQADFHVLRSAGTSVYGYDVTNDRLLASSDEGRTWNELRRPGPMLDLAVGPGDRNHLVSAAEGGLGPALFSSRDGGKSWQAVGQTVGLLAWPATDLLYAATLNGEVLRSADAGATFERRGAVGGQPAALVAEGENDLYVALHDGTVKRSTDGGATWSIRSSP